MATNKEKIDRYTDRLLTMKKSNKLIEKKLRL